MYYALVNTEDSTNLVTWPTEHKAIAFDLLEVRFLDGHEPRLYLVASDGSILQTYYYDVPEVLITIDETAQEVHAKFSLHV